MSCVRDDAALTHDRDAIGGRENLAQFMRDEDDRVTSCPPASAWSRRVLGFLRREHGGGLVEDQHFGLAIERLQDFDALTKADRQTADQRAGIEVETEPLAQFRRLRLGRLPVEPREALAPAQRRG